MYLALSIYVLFISHIQSVNGAQFLNTTSLSLLYLGFLLVVVLVRLL